jgi:hypothetical protein
MPTYTVTGSIQKKDLPDAQNGPAQVIGLNLQDQQGMAINAEWFTKATTPLPGPGSQIEGTIEESPYGPKFKKASAGFGGGGGARSPEDKRSIVRQHSQDMALRALDLGLQLGVVTRPEDSRTFMDLISKTTDWFVKDAAK